MGLLNGLLGNASEVDPKKLKKDFEDILLLDENIEMAFKVIRDMFVFTSKRLILVDKQGFTGKKVEYHSIPYRSISHFSVETAGRFDMDAEMKIWVKGIVTPIEKDFKRGTNIIGIQKSLAFFVLNQK